MNGYPSFQVNFSGVHSQLTTSQVQNTGTMHPDMDIDSLSRIYLLFPQLRNQFVARLREWKLTLNYKQPMASQTLVNHLTSLSEHMAKTFLKLEIISMISIPLCYSRRVDSILAVISDLISLLKADPNHRISDPEFIAGILGMILVQIGRLSISEDVAGDEILNQMDQLAGVIDAQVSIEAYASLDIKKVREQKIAKDIWARMHITDSACFCEQCRPASLADLMVDDSSLDLDFLDFLIADMSFMDLSPDTSPDISPENSFVGVCTDDSMDCRGDSALDLVSMDLSPDKILLFSELEMEL